AEATLSRARSSAKRDEALLAANTVSREAVELSATAQQTAQADLAAAQAAVKTAKINLEYTRVTAPVAGRIGRSAVTEGAYVQQSAATLMATIQQLDSVYVDVTQSSAELLRLRREFATDKLQKAGEAAEVTLLLEDGRAYPEKGTLQFTDVTVDETTGSINLRAEFPNPRGELLAGMFVRARLEQGEDPHALLVPQRAVTRDPKGQAIALVVNAEHKVERRQLVADRSVGNNWLVTSGLVAGEQVIVDGLQKVRPGAEVVTVPAAPEPAK
ncbi:MAG: efflux RND transporter periplasmic adaptor subunit, partial [Nannocystis sp.]